MHKISSWYGAALGVVATAGYMVWKLGWPPLDAFVIGLYFFVVGSGGLLGGGIVLAWRHIHQSRRVLRPILAVLVVLSLPPVACYQRDKRHLPTFLGQADSVQGEVTGRNVLGNLLITFPVDSSRRARMIAPKKRAHQQFVSGDTIWVYRERVPPHRVDVWPPGPDWRVTMIRLLWLWGVVGVLLAGYGPLYKAKAANSEHEVGGLPPGAT